MHEQFANAFYGSDAWKRCRKSYRMRVIYCERCTAMGRTEPGVEVHHKIRLTPENIHDASITLNYDNLELLCEECHKQEHKRREEMRTDPAGHVEL